MEVLNSVNSYNKLSTQNVYNKLLNSTKIVYMAEMDYLDALKLNKYYNNCLNYADCTILNTMYNYKISSIASFDSDFSKIKGINRIC